jgi:asparagine synthase (glutamine-hydrolysing)
MAGWLGSRWPRSPHLPKPLRLATLLENLPRDAASAYYADLLFMSSGDTRKLVGLPPVDAECDAAMYATVTDVYRRCPSSDPVQCAEYADLKIYLPNDPLVKVDRMSMAHSLEVRCPFLDRRVIELAFRIPATRKQEAFRGKVLLRELARRRLPPTIWKLPKKGFTAPISEWIAGQHSRLFESEVLRQGAAIASYLDRAELARRFEAHRAGYANHSYVLWATWVLERWFASISLAAHAPAVAHDSSFLPPNPPDVVVYG